MLLTRVSCTTFLLWRARQALPSVGDCWQGRGTSHHPSLRHAGRGYLWTSLWTRSIELRSQLALVLARSPVVFSPWWKQTAGSVYYYLPSQSRGRRFHLWCSRRQTPWARSSCRTCCRASPACSSLGPRCRRSRVWRGSQSCSPAPHKPGQYRYNLRGWEWENLPQKKDQTSGHFLLPGRGWRGSEVIKSIRKRPRGWGRTLSGYMSCSSIQAAAATSGSMSDWSAWFGSLKPSSIGYLSSTGSFSMSWMFQTIGTKLLSGGWGPQEPDWQVQKSGAGRSWLAVTFQLYHQLTADSQTLQSDLTVRPYSQTLQSDLIVRPYSQTLQ